MCREYVDEERAERQVAAVMQKALEHQGSHGHKFYYAINRSGTPALLAAPIAAQWHSSALHLLLMHHTTA